MKINWKVRLLSVKFWLALVPAILLVGQAVAAVFGYNWDFANLGKQLTAVINSVFAVLAILGVVTDPTTAGVSDSDKALTYTGLISSKSSQIDELQAQIAALEKANKVQATVQPDPAAISQAAAKPASATTSTSASTAGQTKEEAVG
jgi:phi LC3 family holin